MTTMEKLPKVVSQDEWLAARKELLAKEKELTAARTHVNAQRRRLPMRETQSQPPDHSRDQRRT